jgi:penicillin-binding protein 2
MSIHNIEDRHREARLFFIRALIVAFGCLLITLLLIFRLYRLQVVEYDRYSFQSRENQVRLLPLPPRRGIIHDRFGVVLAENVPSFQLVGVSEQLEEPEKMLEELGELISLTEDERSDFLAALKVQPNFASVPIKYSLTEEEVALFARHRHLFSGVDVKASLARQYPFGTTGAHVIGYVGRLSVEDLRRLDAGNYRNTTHTGKYGVESFYENILHGKVGYEQVEVNSKGRVIRSLERFSPTPGGDIYLTIDIRLQKLAEEALGEHRGSIVMVDAKDGEVLALVSQPSFDPSELASGLSRSQFERLFRDESRPMFNRALQGQYPPGSTIKPFIGLAALHHQVLSHRSTYYCNGHYSLQNVDHRYRCWRRMGHGELNLEEAIAQSCDTFFYSLGYDLGIDRISAFLSRFNFGQPTGIDLLGERMGINPSREWKQKARKEPWYHGETVITSIGQGFNLATPVQLAQATLLLANRGKGVNLHILKSEETPEGERVQKTELKNLSDSFSDLAISPYDWEYIIKAMEKVVHGARGTARMAGEKAAYRMAGKTGTSQVYTIKQDERALKTEELPYHLRDHALFIAFAPVENPEVVAVVVVEHGGGGSSVAAPIARQIIDGYMELNSEPNSKKGEE